MVTITNPGLVMHDCHNLYIPPGSVIDGISQLLCDRPKYYVKLLLALTL